MKMNKIIALLLCFVISLGCLASCQTPAEEEQTPDTDNVIDDTSDVTDEQPEVDASKYTVTTTILFATDDGRMKEAVYGMNSSMSIVVDGDNMTLTHNSTTKNTKVVNIYTLVDGILYHSTSISTEQFSATVNEKAEMGENNKNNLLANVGSGAQIGISDFENVNTATSGSRMTFTCKNITAASKLSLEDIFSGAFAEYNATVVLESVEFKLTTKDMLNERNNYL